MGKRRAKRNTYPYVLKDRRKIVYIGITKDPKRREQEHRDEGKRFSRMVVGYPSSEETALKEEEKRIKRYKRGHRSRKPRYNN